MKQLSKIASLERKVGLSARKKPKAQPIPSFVEPMKAKLAAVPSPGDWIYEIKFDGWRALVLKGGGQAPLLSRNQKDFGAKFPEVMVSIADLNAQYPRPAL